MNRIQKARTNALFGLNKVLSYNPDGTVRTIMVPGTEAKQYKVIIRRNGKLSTECLLDTGMGDKPCKGNETTVCYHSISALITAGILKDKALSFHKTKKNAEQINRIVKGKVFEVHSHQGGKSTWLVVH